MNRTEDKGVETKKLKPGSSTANQFDLLIAYRLLISAYIRSTGKTEKSDKHATEWSEQTKQS